MYRLGSGWIKGGQLLAATSTPELIHALLQLFTGRAGLNAEVDRVPEQVNIDILQIDLHRAIHGGVHGAVEDEGHLVGGHRGKSKVGKLEGDSSLLTLANR